MHNLVENADNNKMGLNFGHRNRSKFIGFSTVAALKEKPRAAQFPEVANKSSANTNPYVGLLQRCIGKRTLAEGKGVHAHIIKTGAEGVAGLSLGNHLLHMYSKCQSVEDARQVFDKMQVM